MNNGMHTTKSCKNNYHTYYTSCGDMKTYYTSCGDMKTYEPNQAPQGAAKASTHQNLLPLLAPMAGRDHHNTIMPQVIKQTDCFEHEELMPPTILGRFNTYLAANHFMQQDFDKHRQILSENETILAEDDSDASHFWIETTTEKTHWWTIE